jgi:hypothetical protein
LPEFDRDGFIRSMQPVLEDLGLQDTPREGAHGLGSSTAART